ncbi:serine/threonine-protein kinase/endoribonuclease IRE1b-like [Rhodamnia argentea]|uniref:Serine/threonine-protein kinase/endoribonuclease IRE1b-like n=1 Tax=Rhodamnia argentea TaxID=178133 RepID=A0A8B8MZ45_9MYRT|nr:serine/threonine-protein kinase/endoribonuclease IRE1b-like [Rhodamnia argentea]
MEERKLELIVQDVATIMRQIMLEKDIHFGVFTPIEGLHIEVHEEIGKGHNGITVYEGEYKGNPVAVKTFPCGHVDVEEGTVNFIHMRPHRNVVSIHKVIQSYRGYGLIVQERCDFSLQNLIVALRPSSDFDMMPGDAPAVVVHKKKLSSLKDRMRKFELWTANGHPSQTLLKLMEDVALGLDHFHKSGRVHGDLRPENVLIVKEDHERLSAKLSDAGITGYQTWMGNLAPGRAKQLLHGQSPTPETDMFCFGRLLLFCAYDGQHQFDAFRDPDENTKKNSENHDIEKLDLNVEVKLLIKRLLNPLPQSRPTISDVLIDPAFWSPSTRMDFLSEFFAIVQKLRGDDPQSMVLTILSTKKHNFFDVTWKEGWKSGIEDRYLAILADANVHYNFQSAEHLLRMVRNAWAHRQEVSAGLEPGESLETFFTKRFPNLLMESYQVAFNYLQRYRYLGKFFTRDKR